jgi:hypothetical protein
VVNALNALFWIAIVGGRAESSPTEAFALAKLVREHLKKREFCTIFESHIELYWPVEKVQRAAREEQIHAFAKENGWRATIEDPGIPGIRVTFRNSTI